MLLTLKSGRTGQHCFRGCCSLHQVKQNYFPRGCRKCQRERERKNVETETKNQIFRPEHGERRGGDEVQNVPSSRLAFPRKAKHILAALQINSMVHVRGSGEASLRP